MITLRTRWLAIAVAIFMVFVGAAAEASHFRGAAMVPSVDANGLLTVVTTSFWRKNAVSDASPSVSGLGGMSQISNVVDQSDSRFAKRTQVHTRQLPGPGTYDITWGSCCRVAGIRNAFESSWNMESRIFWDGSTANSPIVFNFSAVQPSVPRGIDYNGNLGAVTGPGNNGTLSYDQALNQNITSQPPGFTIDPNTGDLFIPAANTVLLQDNPSNPGADYAFSGHIFNSDGSSVEFDWLFDAGGPIVGGPPQVADFTLTVGCGEVVNHTFTATDPDNDPLTWSFVGLNGPGVNLPSTFDPNTQAFAWDTTGSTPGQYSAQVSVVDPTNFTDIGILTINIVGFPCAGNDNTSSLGSFKIAVKPQFQPLLGGVPGFNGATGILTSPRLFDPTTVIGRSNPHECGDATDIGGTPVGAAGTIVSDGSFSIVPPGFDGPDGTREVHTEVRSLQMSGGGVTLRAGTAFGLPLCPGEVKSKSGASGDANLDFPAKSFFNMFVEIDVPGLGTLLNGEALLVENDNLTQFPPKVIYIHGNTNAVPVLFKNSNPPNWNAGDCFGFLVLAGHGVSFDVNVPQDVAQFDDEVENLPDGTPRPLLPVGFPGQGDDQTFSMGQFRLAVKDEFTALLQGYPGYDSFTQRLTSPVLRDSTSTIGRSAPHSDGDASDTGGTAVGSAGTIIADSDFSTLPTDGFTEGPAGTREVHTEIRALNMTDPTGTVAVRAGSGLGLPVSPGEVESKSGASGDANLDFPGESFFNVFVEVDLPGIGNFPGATLFNDAPDPLLIVNDNLTKFPPKVVYIHGNTNAVPMLFKDSHPSGLWNAGDCFGFLVLAGHGINFNPDNPQDVDEFQEQTFNLPNGDPRPELPVQPTLLADFRAVEYDDVSQQLVFPNLITEVRVRMENLGPGDATNVTASIASCGPNCTVLDGDVTFGDIPANGSAWSSDTYNLSYNLLAGVVDQGITWDVEYDDPAGVHHVVSGVSELPPAAPAAAITLIPNQTVGYQNYPNAFNPETWIPYQLADAADVTIGVYNASGQMVRHLDLGFQLPGFYLTRGQAAYWNGRNDTGEKVASGVYFYVLQAGSHRTVKKMYLLK